MLFIQMVVSLYLSRTPEAYQQLICIDYLAHLEKKKVLFSKNFLCLKALTNILNGCTNPELLAESFMV